MPESERTSASDARGLVITAVILILVVVGLWVVLGYFWPAGSTRQRASQGDAFGAVGALFSGLAFAGLIVAILLQRKELMLQREELHETRQELAGQRVALESQVMSSDIQRFDSIFFQMVTLNHEIVNGISYRFGGKGEPSVHGRQALRSVWTRVKEAVESVPGDRLAVDDLKRLGEQVVEVREAYHEIYIRYEPILGHYFRNLYRILKYVDESDVSDKASYIGILRAQLSVTELCLVFYNLFDHGYERFLPLCERHQFLQNLPASELAAESHSEILQRHRVAESETWLELAG